VRGLLVSGIDAPATEQTYRAIGRFMFEFSQVEYAIRHYLGEVIGLDEKYFSAVVESYDVGLLVTVVKKVFKTSYGQQDSQIEKLLNRFHELNIERMRVAHGLWVPSMDGGTVHHVPRNKLSPIRLTEQAKQLEKRADEACALRADLERAFNDILYNPPKRW
jgi:hypothetical protein